MLARVGALRPALPLLFAAAVASSLAASACGRSDDAAPARDKLKSGEALYAQMCKSCHGARGEGGRGPTLRDLARPEPALAGFIDAEMPLGEPDRCRGTCAEDIAAYILAAFRGPIVCEAPPPLARGLRLLTRREYRATVADLLGIDPGAAGSTGPAKPACGTHTFDFDAKGRTLRSVHVAGSFNGWAGTVAAGGWPLTQSAGKWTLTRAVPTGKHTYKLVLDEGEWIADPANAATEPDGFGGNNSVLDVAPCPPAGGATGGSTALLDATGGLPSDTRPEGFLFDDHGPGRVVTAVLAGEQLRAARALAELVDPAKLAGCDPVADRAACTGKLVRDLGTRAFRRPLSDAEIARYVAIGAQGDFAAGGRNAIAAMLASPSFLYRSEVGERQPDGTFRLTPWETASALSYFLWGSMPDAELFDAARSGELAAPATIEKQARRLLAHPRARAQIAAWADQWLGGENVGELVKSEAFPFDPAVRAAMREETRAFVTHVVFDGSHRVDELFNAPYTFLNEALAKHYGIDGVRGPEMRKVAYTDGSRAGVLGHGSLLATTGHSDQTSPIRRGLFVRRRLLCQEFAPPPPNAGGVPKVDPTATTRERFAQHTSNPFCKSCHQYIDGVGFGFERFDTVGRPRDGEVGKPIDARGDMNDIEGFGTKTSAPFETLADLGKILGASGAGRACVVKQTWRFARGVTEDDICSVMPVEKAFVDKGGDLRELLVAITQAPDFTVRK